MAARFLVQSSSADENESDVVLKSVGLLDIFHAVFSQTFERFEQHDYSKETY